MQDHPNRIVSARSTILDALRALDALSGGVMTVMVADDDTGAMLGTLTDGDIRRAMLRGAALDSLVTEAMNPDFHSLDAEAPDVEKLAEYRRLGHRLIPLLDSRRRLVRLLDTSRTETLLPLRAVIMAGGKGERLRPDTLTTPKPLLQVGRRAIIDHNIALLAKAGITDITVTVNYLAEQLESHFAGEVCGVRVKTVREPEPMGTIGSVALTGTPAEGATLVMNSDLLTDISLEQMWLQHCRLGAAVTVATIPYNVSVPFAILTTEGPLVTSLVEKPTYTLQANAGIYIIDNSLLRELPASGRTDATDLLERAMAGGRPVAYHTIEGTWIDIGTPNDLRRARELMAYNR